MEFDENGIRVVNQLKLLQYRAAYINGTPVQSDQSKDHTLMLIEVARLESNNSLKFLEGSKQGIWPSMLLS